MFSVPYDFNLYSNWSVRVSSKDTNCDSKLYCKMYHSNERGFVRGKAKDPYKGEDVTTKSTMTDSCEPVLEVEASSTCKQWMYLCKTKHDGSHQSYTITKATLSGSLNLSCDFQLLYLSEVLLEFKWEQPQIWGLTSSCAKLWNSVSNVSCVKKVTPERL